MGITYTPEQEQVIHLHGCNLLVSASAGSGKTAVLVERIIAMIKDRERKVNIDRLLIVTFTSAAAGEMKERISRAIAKCLEEEPENEHLQRQAALVHNAQITTIDSFCLYVIRNNFNDIGLDPGFRVADEGELKLMKQDALSALLEEKFQEGDEDFLHCVECYSTGTKETLLEESILRLYEFSMSYPWPEEWLLQRREDYGCLDAEEMERTHWGRYAQHSVRRILKDCAEKIGECCSTAEQPDGPYMYGELLDKEREMLLKASEKESLRELEQAVLSLQFGRLPSKKDDSVSPVKRELAKTVRAEVKELVKNLKERYFFLPLERAAEQNGACARAVNQLIDLTLGLKKRLDAMKREKNVIDFGDMEHFALDILLEKTESGVRPTKTARDYRKHFEEIMTDEYQDSNLVQEYLLKSISGEEEGKFNRFMVGDVKQSIYKFRLARPELFMEKFHTYTLGEGERRRIDLHKNFRSRGEVIESANFIFRQIMGTELGGLDYNDEAALYLGADYYPEAAGNETELMLVEKPSKEDGVSAKEAEAGAIAKRIHSLLKEQYVTDKETGKLRKASYKDIVILLRTNQGWDEQFKKVFEQEGIPSYITSKTGYFSANEIQNIIQLLRVLDNPLQDIPLYGVMHGFFGGFSEEETAALLPGGGGARKKLYSHIKEYACTEEEKDSALWKKCRDFLAFVEEYRLMTVYMPIHELLRRILEDTGYLQYITALPAGEQRRANVEMLLEKALAFEQTSYYGLFHFIRYIEQLEKYDVDYGEANILDENADIVRIMSIHKSKGLEFPICFVAGLSKRFNLQDVNKPLIVDVDMGIGTDYVDPEARLRNKTLRGNVLARKMHLDNLSEELRVLYVALTRAKEKLILTGVLDKPVEKLAALLPVLFTKTEKLSFSRLSAASCLMDFILPAMMRHPEMEAVLQENGIEAGTRNPLNAPAMTIRVLSREELMKQEIAEAVHRFGRREMFERLRDLSGREAGALPAQVDGALLAVIQERFGYQYPYRSLEKLYTKTTVSELKKAGQQEEEDFSFHLIKEEEIVPYIPDFAGKGQEVSGTVRGSAYHKVLELLNPDTGRTAAAVREEIEAMQAAGKLDAQYAHAVLPGRIAAFLKTRLAERMRQAQKGNKLYRERPFVYGISADRLDSRFPKEETVLIQGIIDVYFEEEDGLVVADYKTDVVDSADILIGRYKAQLDYYEEALSKITGKKVKEKIIYSFHLGKEYKL